MKGYDQYDRPIEVIANLEGGDVVVKTWAKRWLPYESVKRTITVEGGKNAKEIEKIVFGVQQKRAMLNVGAIRALAEALQGYGDRVWHCGSVAEIAEINEK